VTIDWGLLDVLGIEALPAGDRLVCRSVGDDAWRSVDRRRELARTTPEADRFVIELQAILNPLDLP